MSKLFGYQKLRDQGYDEDKDNSPPPRPDTEFVGSKVKQVSGPCGPRRRGPVRLVKERKRMRGVVAYGLDERNNCTGECFKLDPSKLISPACPGDCGVTLAECYLVHHNCQDWHCIVDLCKSNNAYIRIRRDRSFPEKFCDICGELLHLRKS